MEQPSQRKALESLLQDDDESTRLLILGQIRNHPEVWRDVVMSWRDAPSPQLREAAREIVEFWQRAGSEPGFPAWAPTVEQGIFSWAQLESFCWLLAQAEDPHLEEEGYRKTLDSWAQRVAQLAGTHPGPIAQAAALREVLAVEVGLKGNRTDYYAPANNYLNRVIDTRKGIPLSLSLIYIFTAMRLGWNAWGMDTPGHYLMAVENQILDPYFGGVLLAPQSLAERFGLPLEECAQPGFHRSSPHNTAQRMLANLLNSYTRLHDHSRCQRLRAYLKFLQENAP